ncbi:MAG: MarR family winged helix-turn-helix transcriptional regulator [Chloroflexota bacterium]
MTATELTHADDFLVGYSLSFISNKLSAGLSRLLREQYQIGLVEWRIMIALAREPKLQASQISKVANIDKGLISKSFKVLAKKELITLAPLPDEGRRRLARLTAQGQALYEEIWPVFAAREAKVLAGLDEKRREELFESLQILRANLDKL